MSETKTVGDLNFTDLHHEVLCRDDVGRETRGILMEIHHRGASGFTRAAVFLTLRGRFRQVLLMPEWVVTVGEKVEDLHL